MYITYRFFHVLIYPNVFAYEANLSPRTDFCVHFVSNHMVKLGQCPLFIKFYDDTLANFSKIKGALFACEN